MIEERLAVSAKLLLDFGSKLGIKATTWSTNENLERIKFIIPDMEYNKAKNLTVDQVHSLWDLYGNSLECKFRLGDYQLLCISAEVDQADIDQFLKDAQASPTVIFDFTLNKMQFISTCLGEVHDSRIFLYLFPEALEYLVTSDLKEIENMLWPSESVIASKVILLIPSCEIMLDGEYLAIIGGEKIADLSKLAIASMGSNRLQSIQSMYQICRNNLRWQENWIQRITPLHLNVNAETLAYCKIISALKIQLANSIILFTADVTHGDINKPMQATYAGANQRVELFYMDPGKPIEIDALAGVNHFMDILKWIYDSKWSADRLPLVQISIAQALNATTPNNRYHLLLHNAANIFETMKWHWKDLLENKVDAYISQVQVLEDYVASVVKTFADEISGMIKSLSDTMLAAVGVLLGSFIAALFKDNFDPTIFKIGLIVYAIYVLVFPLGYNMYHQWQRYSSLVEDFEERRQRFEERLYPEKVSKIIKGKVDSSRKRFFFWFQAIFLAYILIIILSLLAVVMVPGIMSNSISQTMSLNSTIMP